MLNELSKITLKRIRKRILICGIIAVILFLIALPCLKIYLEGTVDLYSLSASELPDAYVEADINFLVGYFAEKTVTEDKRTVKSSRFYIVPVGEYEFIGLEVDSKDTFLANRIMDASWDYIMAESDTDVPLTEFIHVKGTIRKMNKKITGYYEDWFINEGFTDEEIEQYCLKYVLEPDHVGYLDISSMQVLLYASAMLVIYCIIILILGLTKLNLLSIKLFLKKNAESVSITLLDEDYENALDINGKKFGKRFTVVLKGIFPIILKNKDIIWAYRKQINHKYGTSHNLILNTKEKKTYTLPMKHEEDVYAALDHYANNNPHIVLGFTKDLKKCYQKDFSAFLEMSRRQEANAAINEWDSTANM